MSEEQHQIAPAAALAEAGEPTWAHTPPPDRWRLLVNLQRVVVTNAPERVETPARPLALAFISVSSLLSVLSSVIYLPRLERREAEEPAARRAARAAARAAQVAEGATP